MTWADAAAWAFGLYLAAAAAGIGWLWARESRRVAAFIATLDALEAKAAAAADPRPARVCDCGRFTMHPSGFEPIDADGVRHRIGGGCAAA